VSSIFLLNIEIIFIYVQTLLREAKDPLAEWLDKIQGSTVTEHSIFTKLSQHWESEFHKDMDALNVRININTNNISHRLHTIVS